MNCAIFFLLFSIVIVRCPSVNSVQKPNPKTGLESTDLESNIDGDNNLPTDAAVELDSLDTIPTDVT